MRPTLRPPHLDSYTLLRHVAGELDEVTRRRVERHLQDCSRCTSALEEVRWLDAQLSTHKAVAFAPSGDRESLPKDDPFRERPPAVDRSLSRSGPGGRALSETCLREAAAAEPIRDRILSSEGEALGQVLADLDLSSLRDRYALGFALDEAPRHMTEGPLRYRPLVEKALKRLKRERVRPLAKGPSSACTEVDYAYPLVELVARAHLLDGIVCNWTTDFDRGGESFRKAWRAFGEGAASDLTLSTAELHESQRRTFSGDPTTGLVLAERARATLAELGVEDEAAKASFSVGLALSALGRNEESLVALRSAATVFSGHQLWSSWASVVNSIATCLLELGRLDEAKREYARALRLTAHGERPAMHAFIRYNLALALFRAGHYADAVAPFRSAVRLFAAQAATADALTASLYLVECLARTGQLGAARRKLSELESSLSSTPGLDASVLRGFVEQLSGAQPDFDLVSRLRDQVEVEIQRRRGEG